jgi:hypothetical protein
MSRPVLFEYTSFIADDKDEDIFIYSGVTLRTALGQHLPDTSFDEIVVKYNKEPNVVILSNNGIEISRHSTDVIHPRGAVGQIIYLDRLQ